MKWIRGWGVGGGMMGVECWGVSNDVGFKRDLSLRVCTVS